MIETVLEAQHLYKRFGNRQAVSDLSLQIRQGEVFGFLGPNGAGKTTSIKMFCGLLRPDSGRVFIKGRAANDGQKHPYSRLGLCPQEIVLWKTLTCIEQLQFIGEMYALAPQESRRRGQQLLAELELTEKTNQLARTLSGGMQRRLNLAMALVHDPEILILDEPEAGLDPQSRVLLRDFIRRLAQKKTIILTTHDMEEADRLADRVAIIDHGELLVIDTPEKLKKSIGEGDILEISLAGQSEAAQKAVSILDGYHATLHTNEKNIVELRSLDAVNLLPAILETLKGSGLLVSEVRLRQNSLEDVFVHLTGRGLRE
jgi:ABC-2 type transport system ATP-binding protein